MAASKAEPLAPMAADPISQTQPLLDPQVPANKEVFAMLQRVRGGNEEVHELRKDQAQIIIGRHPTCDIVVRHQNVSSQHVRIYRDATFRYFAEALSNNGCFIGDTLMTKGNVRGLLHGDRLSLCVHPDIKGDVAPFAVFAFFQVATKERADGDQQGRAAPKEDCGDTVLGTEEHVRRTWDLRHLLGSGNFSEVKLGVKVASEPGSDRAGAGVQRAVKIIDKRKFESFQKKRESRLQLSEEAEMLMKLDHPGIVRVYEYFDTPDHLYLIMDLMEGGDLLQSIMNDGCFREGQAQRFFRHILDAVKYLHGRNIVHRDLKPENILINTRDRAEMRPKIADFGLARHNMKSNDCRTFCGTPHYFAPEVIRTYEERETAGDDAPGSGYGKQVDMWSLGVILYILLSGIPPFEEEDLYKQIIAGNYEFDVVEWQVVSLEAKDLVRSLMCITPKARLTVEKACVHKWFTACVDERLAKGVSVCDSPGKRGRSPGSRGAVPKGVELEADSCMDAAVAESDSKRPRTGPGVMQVDGGPSQGCSAAGA